MFREDEPRWFCRNMAAVKCRRSRSDEPEARRVVADFTGSQVNGKLERELRRHVRTAMKEVRSLPVPVVLCIKTLHSSRLFIRRLPSDFICSSCLPAAPFPPWPHANVGQTPGSSLPAMRSLTNEAHRFRFNNPKWRDYSSGPPLFPLG